VVLRRSPHSRSGLFCTKSVRSGDTCRGLVAFVLIAVAVTYAPARRATAVHAVQPYVWIESSRANHLSAGIAHMRSTMSTADAPARVIARAGHPNCERPASLAGIRVFEWIARDAGSNSITR